MLGNIDKKSIAVLQRGGEEGWFDVESKCHVAARFELLGVALKAAFIEVDLPERLEFVTSRGAEYGLAD
jgi:hypothetical protein